MDGLRTIAPRTVPNPASLPLPPATPGGHQDVYAWNLHRNNGVPAWATASRAIPERLQVLADRHRDVSLDWHVDPAGRDTSVRLPVLTFGREGAPTAVFVAGQHGREPAVPSAAVGWAERLLAARDAGDPQARWLLESRRVVLLPVANPRGHAGALDALDDASSGPHERAPINRTPRVHPDEPRSPFERFMDQRKNQSNDHDGVDLNRSHPSSWLHPDAAIDKWAPQNGPSSKDYTRDQKEWFENHPGWTRSSEPETRIIDELLRRERPIVVADLHQYGNFVLPQTPVGTSIGSGVGATEKLGRSTGLNWIWDGASDVELAEPSDPFADGGGQLHAHGVARGADLGLTIEFGRAFAPTPADHARIELTMDRALTRLVRDADAPRTTSRGPDVSSSPRATTAGWNIGVSDHAAGSAAIAGAELVTDPAAAPGTGIRLETADGAFDEPVEQVRVPLGAGTATDIVGIRARDADGNWGAVTALKLASSRD